MEGRSETWLEKFGQQVRQRRKEAGLSQVKFAGKLDISRTYLSMIERGQAGGLTLDMIDKVSLRLGFGRVSEALGNYRVSNTESRISEPLPTGLAELKRKLNLPEGDIDLLLTLRFRGRKPQTMEQWEMAYNIIEAMSRVWGD